MNKRLTGILQILLGAAFFGLIPIFVRFGQSIDTASLVFFRAFFGAAFTLLIIKLMRKPLAKFGEERLKIVLWAVVFLLAIGSYFTSLKLIPIAPAVLLLYSQSIFIVLLSKFWLKEKIRAHTLIALALSIAGVVLIISPSGFGFGGDSLGYFFAMAAAFLAGLNFIIPKVYFKKYDTFSLTFYQSLWALPMLLPFVLLSPPLFTPINIGIFAGLGLFCTALAFMLIYAGSRKVPGQYIGVLQTTEALVPILLGFVIFSETPSLPVIIGGSLLIVGYLLISIKGSKK